MRNFGINPGQDDGLYLILWKAFNKISKGQANEWVSNYAQIINLTIKNTIRTLVDMGLWENIFDSLGRDGLNTFILKILMEFFDEIIDTIVQSISSKEDKLSFDLLIKIHLSKIIIHDTIEAIINKTITD